MAHILLCVDLTRFVNLLYQIEATSGIFMAVANFQQMMNDCFTSRAPGFERPSGHKSTLDVKWSSYTRSIFKDPEKNKMIDSSYRSRIDMTHFCFYIGKKLMAISRSNISSRTITEFKQLSLIVHIYIYRFILRLGENLSQKKCYKKWGLLYISHFAPIKQ